MGPTTRVRDLILALILAAAGLGAVGLAGGWLVCSTIGCEWLDLERVENFHPTFADAVTAGAVSDEWLWERWIPPLVPPSATDIREVHNVDTNEIWLTFRFESRETDVVTRWCRPPDAVPNDALVFPRRRGAKWWPRELVRHEPTDARDTYRFYRCGGGFLAMDTIRNAAYYWE